MNASRGFWPLRDLPVLGWLLATVVVAVAHPLVPAPRWLMIHLLMLGAVSHAILVWSRHFTDALLRTPSGDRAAQSRRLLLLNAGVLAVVVGVASGVWPVTLIGATAVGGAALWHGASLGRQLRSALPARFAVTVRYYLAAACFLPVGATVGTVLARGIADPWQTRLTVTHASVNLLGWVGLTVTGTLVTLWPTMLRTRITEGIERAAARALPILVVAVLVTATSAAVGSRALTAMGLTAYLLGLGLLGKGVLEPLRRKPASTFSTLSVLAALCWLVGSLVALTGGIATAGSWLEAGATFHHLVPFLAAGFGAQILLGALSYLVPVALGGGPTPVRAANTVLDRAAALRVTVVNTSLVVALLPASGTVRVLTSMLVLAGLGSALPLVVLAVRASRLAKRAGVVVPPEPTDRRSATSLTAVGFSVVALVLAAGVASDPRTTSFATTSATGSVVATGETTTVEVSARDMRFTPSTISLPSGNRLVIHLTNTDDTTVHDLVLDSGDRTDRLAPGTSATLDVGVVGRDLEGWCSVVGHRQMGMVLHVTVTGAAEHPQTDHLHADRASPDFTPYDAVLPPVTEGRIHRRTLVVRDELREVAPGVTQRVWTYGGSLPGPILHGRVGDRFVVTLVNEGSIGHSIDFHAGALAPGRPMRTIPPGQSLVYRFTATRAGIWMYHCSTMPMSAHIANGLFGAVVIEPRALPRVDRSYVLVQSELYLGKNGGTVDVAKLESERPDAVVFNGYANQYDAHPLEARVGERVRVWVLDAGPNRATSFHVVGAQFDKTYAEGAYLLSGGEGGAQSLSLGPAQGGFVELTFPEAGDYPFVSHVMVDAERGAHGLFRVLSHS